LAEARAVKRLVKNIGWLLGGRGLNAVLSLVYLAIATRTLGLASFGHFALILAMGQTVLGLANFQTWQFVVRWGAGEDGPGEATGFALALDLLSVAFGIVLSAVLVLTAQYWLPLPPELRWLAFAYCVVLLLCMRSTPIGLLRLRFAFARATAAEATQPIVRAVGAAVVATLFPSVLGFVIVWMISEVVVAASIWIAAASRERIDFSQISLHRIPREHPDAWPFAWSTGMTGALNVSSKQILILLVGAIGGETAAGAFRVAAQLGQGLVQLAQTISKAVYPELVHARDEAVDMARRIANFALVGGILAVIFAVFFGRWFIYVIAGPEFRGVYWPLIILAVAGAIELVGASFESLLVSAGRAGTAFIVRALPLGLGFALLDAAMNWQGVKGAALIVMFASALAVMGFWVTMLSMRTIRITVEPLPDQERST
jgi:O-antigen/teichoic acid export membrane protein